MKQYKDVDFNAKEAINKLHLMPLHDIHKLRKDVEAWHNEYEVALPSDLILAIIDELTYRLVEIGWQDLKKNGG